MSHLRKIYGFRFIQQQNFHPELVPRADVNQSQNTEKLSVGVSQYNNIVPKNASLEVNKKNIGFYARPSITNLGDLNEHEHPHNRYDIYARIYMRDTNHMHLNPKLPLGYKWVVQHERRAVWRPHWSGWTYSNESFTRYESSYPTLEDAIEYCRYLGFGYTVQYPKWRNSSRQTYSDNFKWKGFDVEDPDS